MTTRLPAAPATLHAALAAIYLVTSTAGCSSAASARASASLTVPATPVQEHLDARFDFEPNEEQREWANDRASRGLESARGYLASYRKVYPVQMLRALVDTRPDWDGSVHIDLALAYLSFGQFDSAIATLDAFDRRPASVRRGLESVSKIVRGHAERVRSTLTAARNALLAEGVDVAYPDERIFLRALNLAPNGDDYLRLNLLDAYDAAHPDSAMAGRYVFAANLSFQEDATDATNVPGPRGRNAFDRAMGAAQAAKTDADRLYAAVRLTQFLIARLDLSRGFFDRSDILNVLAAARLIDAPPKTKAFLLYGDTLRYLKIGWERDGFITDLTRDMQRAVRLNPDEPAYAELLNTLRRNGSRIEREVIAADKRRSEAALARYVGVSNPLVAEKERAKQARSTAAVALVGVVGLLMLSGAAGGGGGGGTASSGSCSFCYGGVGPCLNQYGTSMCTYCGGTGIGR